ncbi:MAG: hypothetical protein LBL94_01785 [Prevotellaceae bacterium]|jgi:hypothetical protein|nr:hypothetical protein [Prevotellaceae bacterium]
MSRAEKKREQRVALGKYLYDASKLTFTALVLSAMFMLFRAEELEAPVMAMLAFGIIIAGLLAIIANNLNK